MSEKIYACLLRLFPSAFRRLYGEEAIQLLRDRLRDEVGLLPRSRLILNLTTDIFMALPQAYSNSYAETALLTPHFEGAPTFQALPTEPIRPAAIAFASVLTLATLAIVSFLMSRPTPYLAAQNDPKSPIESVIERLNQTTSSAISPDFGASATPDLPSPTSTNLVGSKVRALPKANTAPYESGPLRAQENSNTNYSASRSSALIATSSTVAGVQPRQNRPTQTGNPSDPPVSIIARVADLSGVWAGKSQEDGGEVNLPQWFVLKEYREKLTGTGGPASSEQYPIVYGLVTDGSVSFELKHGDQTFLYDLRFGGKKLQGTLSIRHAGELRVVTVSLERIR